MLIIAMSSCADLCCYCSGKKPEKFYVINENDNKVLFKIENCYTAFLFTTVLVDLLEKFNYEKWELLNDQRSLFQITSVQHTPRQPCIKVSKRLYPNFTKKKQMEFLRLDKEESLIFASQLKWSLTSEYHDILFGFDAVATILAEKYSDELEVFEKTKGNLNTSLFRYGKTYKAMMKFVQEEAITLRCLLDNLVNSLQQNNGPVAIQYNLNVDFMKTFFV